MRREEINLRLPPPLLSLGHLKNDRDVENDRDDADNDREM